MINHLSDELFEDLLFLAIAFTAFYSLARLGELVPSSYNSSNNILYVENLSVYTDANPHCILINLPMAKTRYLAYSDTLIVHQTFDNLCPIRIMSLYLNKRLKLTLHNEPRFLFCHQNGSLATKQ
jgi:hypothetical protein